MLAALLVCQTNTATTIIASARKQLDQAQSITVTRIRTTEEFPKTTKTKYWFRKGGFFRSESPNAIDLSNPRHGWTYRADQKIYQSRPPLPTTINPMPVLDLDILSAGLPIVGTVKSTVWHKHPALRIELDARKQMTKETKLFVYFDPKTNLPIGISANLGSVTQVMLYEELRIDPKIDDKMFQFTPPKDWREVTATTGGWK